MNDHLEAEREAYLAAFPDLHFRGAWTARNEQDFAVWLAARRASSVPAIQGTVDEAAAYRLWRDCELSEDAWFMQHLSDYLPVGRAPTAAEWDAAMLRVMQDRASHPSEAKAGEDA